MLSDVVGGQHLIFAVWGLISVWILCASWWCKWFGWWQEQWKQKIIFWYWLVL